MDIAEDNVETYNVFSPKTLFTILRFVLCADLWLWNVRTCCLWTLRLLFLWNVLILGTLLAPLVAGASRPQGSLREPLASLSRYRFRRYPTLT